MFDLEMCFGPQRRGLFGQLDDIWTSKSGPYPRCFLRFHFPNVLRATTACTTSQLPKVLREWCALTLFTSRHNGVEFFDISTSLLNMGGWVLNWRPPYQCISKALRLPRKNEPWSYEVLHLSRKIIFPNLDIWCSKIKPLSGNQRLDLRTSWWTCLLYCRSSRVPGACHSFWNSYKLSRFAHVWQIAEPPVPATQQDAATSKNGPSMWCFCRWFPHVIRSQGRAHFRHPNCQKCSGV